MAEIQHQQEFAGAASDIRTVVVSGAGTATLQCQGVGSAWVDVPDGAFIAPTVASIHCALGSVFRFNISGADVDLSQ